MLQVAGRTSKLKHKALLMAPTPPTDSIPKPAVLDEASSFPGEAFERMCMDPELIRTRKQFLIGVAAVCVIVIGVAVRGFMPSAPRPMVVQSAAPAPAAAVEPVSEARVVSTAVPLPLGTSLAQGLETPKRISFRSAGEVEVKPETDPMEVALESFLQAATVEAKLAQVHDPARVEAAMRAYYQKHQVGPLSYSHVERFPQKLQGGFTEFRVVLRDGTRKFAAVVQTPEGARVDWASFVALGDLEWEQMREIRPEKPVLMRVLASRGDRFSGSFSDSQALSCVHLVPAANPSAGAVFGYVPKESDLGRQIAVWLASAGSDPIPLTVKIAYPQDAISHDQAWISEVVVPGWVTLAANTASHEGG